jgi:hypothetical protein
MPDPETTSAEAFEHYVGGEYMLACRGKAWRDIKAWIIVPLRDVDVESLPPSVSRFSRGSFRVKLNFRNGKASVSIGVHPWLKFLPPPRLGGERNSC